MVSEAPLELVLRLLKQHNDHAVFVIAMAQEIQDLRADLAEAQGSAKLNGLLCDLGFSNLDTWRDETIRLRAALAAETQRADRETAEVTVQVEARREIEVALAAAERERDEAITSYMAICDGNTAWKHIIARVGEAEKLYAAMKDKLALAEIALATRDTAFEAETARAERAEAALAAETQRADREAAEVAVQVEARREIEVALAEAEWERDEACFRILAHLFP